VHRRDGTEEQSVVGHGEEHARRREEHGAERAEGGNHDGERHDHRTGTSNDGLRGIGGDERRATDLLDGEDRKVGEVREHVDDHDSERAADERARQVALRLLHFTGDVAEIAPAVVGPERGHERETEGADGETPRGRRRRVVAAGLRQSQRERDENDEHEPGELPDRRQVRHQRAPAHAHDVERGRDEDRNGGDVIRVAVVRLDRGVESQDTQEVFGERDGNGA
jgi:hypothetical protein